MERIGILGGTFNPIHVGHLAVGQTAGEQCSLDKVFFVPSHRPPHKNIPHLASARDRYRMVALAVQDNPLFAASDFEVRREGRSYSIDTVRYFRESFPKARLFFIIGGDSFPTLHTWKAIDEILKVVTFIVVNRPGYVLNPEPHSVNHQSVTMPGMDVASSYLRRQLRRGRSVRYFVPDAVCAFLQKQKLYQS